MTHERAAVPAQEGRWPEENKLEKEARQYAKKHAHSLARKEAQRVIDARRKMGHITSNEEYDAEYEKAFQEHYWHLFHQRLKELSSGEKEE